MPQLSLYLTEENLIALRTRAEEEGVSLSKHVSSLIERDALNHGWPEGFWKLYGAIEDESFTVPDDPPPADGELIEALFAQES